MVIGELEGEKASLERTLHETREGLLKAQEAVRARDAKVTPLAIAARNPVRILLYFSSNAAFISTIST